jgi:general secretion pathway protein E
MDSTSSTAFADHLAGKKLLPAGAAESPVVGQSGGLGLSKLWERTDLSAGDFADEVAEFYNVPRVSLPDMLAAPPLTKLFARRFLREMFVFPYLSADGQATLAAADPGDTAAIRAAEIVLGGQITIRTVSFEDINTILNQRLGEEDVASPVGMQPPAVRDDDIESLRDLASGAPVVRAVNDLLEKAVELRATDIHIEPFRAGLTVRMRVDGLLRAVPAPARAPPQALVSRIKNPASSGSRVGDLRGPDADQAEVPMYGVS